MSKLVSLKQMHQNGARTSNMDLANPKSAGACLHVPQLLWNPILSQLPHESAAISYASGHNLYDFEVVMGLIFLGWNKFQPECQRKKM